MRIRGKRNFTHACITRVKKHRVSYEICSHFFINILHTRAKNKFYTRIYTRVYNSTHSVCNFTHCSTLVGKLRTTHSKLSKRVKLYTRARNILHTRVYNFKHLYTRVCIIWRFYTRDVIFYTRCAKFYTRACKIIVLHTFYTRSNVQFYTRTSETASFQGWMPPGQAWRRKMILFTANLKLRRV